MKAVLKSKDLKINKTDWIPVKFGEVVFEPKESTKNAAEDGIEHVVGLEHITSGYIHLRRSASIEEATTFTKKFAKGDVLFGRRRAYLKKAAQAEFSGICSGDITVFRAKENLMPELLPFIVSNDAFFDYAVKHSAGGLSPRVKFKDLAKYEFLLPPKDQQAKLAKLLWAMDDVIEKEKEVLEKFEVLEETFRFNEIEKIDDEGSKLGDLIFPMSKIAVGKIEKSNYLNKGNYPIIDQSLDFITGYTNDDSIVYKGDLPVLVFGDHTTIIKFIDFPFVMGADGTKVIKAKDNLDMFYLFHAIKKLNLQPQGYRRHFTILKESIVKVPNNDSWLYNFRTKLKQIDLNISFTESKIKSSEVLLKSMINQVF